MISCLSASTSIQLFYKTITTSALRTVDRNLHIIRHNRLSPCNYSTLSLTKPPSLYWLSQRMYLSRFL